MATTALRGVTARTSGDLPTIGSPASAYVLTGSDLRDFDRDGTVLHSELVADIGRQPGCDAALAAL